MTAGLRRTMVIFVLDMLCIAGSFFLALWMRFEFRLGAIPQMYLNEYLKIIGPWIVICLVVFQLFRLYNIIWNIISIAEQIRIGLGDPLGYTQEDITFEGVGIEYRLIAEDPDNRFTPWVGRIDAFGWPSHPWLKMPTHVPTDESYEIPTEFDPNLALAIIWGENLEQAKERGMQFLDELTLQGENQSGELKSNVNFLRANTGRILRF